MCHPLDRGAGYSVLELAERPVAGLAEVTQELFHR
jgi:hypothetical protein